MLDAVVDRRFFHKRYFVVAISVLLRERSLEKDSFAVVCEGLCNHAEHGSYVQRQFDILNGFELVLTRCINCHKTIKLEARKLG
jgi:hypothetical protein